MAAGDLDLARSRRQAANDTLAAGSLRGCVWSAALQIVRANVAPHGTTTTR